MNTPVIKSRFAPSPTGELHLGNVRTALKRDLCWLGLDWQAGPDVGGETESYFQFERSAIYDRYFEQLIASGKACPCYCSEQELAVSGQKSY